MLLFWVPSCVHGYSLSHSAVFGHRHDVTWQRRDVDVSMDAYIDAALHPDVDIEVV